MAAAFAAEIFLISEIFPTASSAKDFLATGERKRIGKLFVDFQTKKVVKNPFARIMVRAAAKQFFEFHHGVELLDEDFDGIELEHFKQRRAPRLSDEDIED